ncbi:MAG: GntR family transcriptional regulator [Chloroflexota bacterium]
MDIESESLVDRVFERILHLLRGRGLFSVEVLRAANLAEELGVSRTPVNLALVRLQSEGLIQKNVGRGWATIPLSLEDIESIFDLKDLLEPYEARCAAENITPQTSTTLLAIVREMERSCETDDLDVWLSADNRYHSLLQAIVGNRQLTRFQQQLNHQLYRLQVGHLAMKGRLIEACQEHRLVAEAIVAGDPDLAAENARRHISTLRANVIDVVKNILLPFLGQ